MDSLIDLCLKMPPVVAAALTIIMIVVVYRFGTRIIDRLDGHTKELKDQSAELKVQSKDLSAIKVQTTKTNGKVIALETAFAGHDKQDDERHREIDQRHRENKENFKEVLDNQDIMMGKISHLERMEERRP